MQDCRFPRQHARDEIAQRYQGARAALADLRDDVTLTEVPTHLTPELSGGDIGAFLDSVDEMPDGIFAASDMIALNTIQALVSRGLAVPDQVRVVGFDDLPIARSTVPPLTTIRQDVASGASQMVDCLLKRIDDKQTGSIVLNPELIVRGST